MTDVLLTTITVVATGVSAEDYLHGDWPPNSQLVDGEVIVSDPTFHHQAVCRWLLVRIGNWVEAGPNRGLVGYGGNWVAPTTGNVYHPDVWWMSEARRGIPRGTWADAVPELAVEVSSPGTWAIDRGRKRDVYADGGTDELWLFDRTNERVLVHHREDTHLTLIDELGAGATLVTPLLPGLTLDVAAAFAQ